MPLLALAFVAGIGLALQCASLPPAPACAGLLVAALAAAALRGWPLAAVLAGFLAATAQGQRALGDDWPCSRDRERVALTGMVVTPAEERADRLDFDLAPDAAARAAGVPGRVRLTWYEPTAVPRPGDTWRMVAVLRCRSGFHNPGGFDRELDLLRRGLGATGYLAGPDAPQLLARHAWRHPVERARAGIGERLAAATAGSRSTGVLQGLAVGLRGSIEPAIREAFVNTGTAHLIAISGMHVTAFALVTLFLTRRVYRLAGFPGLSAAWPAWQAACTLVITTAYGLLAGASLPTVRTVAMVGVALALRVARRNAAAGGVVAASALLLAATDPLGVTSAGFWLSFGAVAALVGLVDAGAGAWRALRQFVRAQLAVSVVLAPVLVASFGGVPLTGPLVNALAIPLFSFLLLPATLTGLALLPLAPGLADRFWVALAAALDRCWPALQWAAGLPWAVFSPPAVPGWLVVLATAACLLAVVVPVRGSRWLAGIALACLAARPPVPPPPGAFDLTVLDVGQGLAVVVETARRVLLFDTGPAWRSGGTAAAVTVLPYLRARGIRQLDAVVVSHADADHAGGLGEVVGPLGSPWIIGADSRAGRADERCVAGRRWNWDGVSFEVLHPAADAAFTGNDGSCALRVGMPGAVALLLADTQRAAEEAMLSRPLQADVVVVPHHGSASSSTAAFVAAVGPSRALVSAGFGNRWGLPRPEVVARWQGAGAEVATTASGGALSVRLGPGAVIGPLGQSRRAAPRWWRRR
jgi:competence protein ComEC